MRFRKIVCLVLSVVLMLSGISTVKANDVKKYDFASFTEADAVSYVKEQGIFMPEGLEDINGYEAIILKNV